MIEMRDLVQQCEEIEKLVQDVRVETIGCGNETIIELAQELEEVLEMGRMLDVIIEGE